MSRTREELRELVDLERSLVRFREWLKHPPPGPGHHVEYIRERVSEMERELSLKAQGLSPVDKLRTYSLTVTPGLLHSMDTDPFILPFLPFYLVGLVSTLPGHIAEGITGVIKKVRK